MANKLPGMVTFITVLAYLSIVDKRVFYFDARTYYNLSNIFLQNGSFSVFNYPLHLRGIIFPLVLYPFNRLSYFFAGETFFGWRIFIALLSAIFASVFPILFKGLNVSNFFNKTIAPVILPLVLLFVFYGVFEAPLADLVSLYFLIFSLALIQTAFMKSNFSEFQMGRQYFKIALLFIFSGALLYAAYNTRTIYQFSIIGALLIIIINRTSIFKHNIFVVLLIALGFFLGGLPQALSNLNNTGNFSLFLPQLYHQGQSLNMFQLVEGIRRSGYETYVGDSGAAAAFSYWNKSGQHMLQRLYNDYGIYRGNFTFRNYLTVIFRYPLEMLGTYVRHLVFMLNPISGAGYIRTRSNMRFVYTMLNFSMLFMLFTWLIYKLKDVKTAISTESKNAIASITAILLPFIAIIPGAVEERFGIGFWVTAYGIIFYCINWKELFNVYRKQKILYGLTYLITFSFFIAILTEIYANNRENILLPILNLGGAW